MGSVGASKPVLVRKDISSLTKSQQDVMEKAYRDVEFARTHTLEEWAIYQETRHAATDIEGIKKNYVIVSRWSDYMYKSMQDALDSVMQDVHGRMERYKDYYNSTRNGEVLARTSSNTLKALEKRGFIKIVKDGKTGIDTIQIVEDEKRRKYYG